MTSPQFHTPRPAPVFIQSPQTFSTKKSRGHTPINVVPPKPPIKSAPPVSRIFPKKEALKAQPVSFKSPDKALLSPHYNESNVRLFFDQCFSIVCRLGVGSFGEVFKVRSKEDGCLYAVKRSRQRFRGESDRNRKLEEVAKHESLPEHTNCVRFLKAWEEKQHLYIQTELCKTSLNLYAEENHNIPEKVIWNYLVDLLMAVRHLHEHELVHMDIKPENIFISANNVCKLGDFGLVIDLMKDIEMSNAQEGDPKYLAPELMDGQFGKPADIFSLGITILELASDLDLPRGGDLWHHLRSGHLPEEFMLGVSPELKEIIKWMMEPDPHKRPTVQQVLQHEIVEKVLRERLDELSVIDDEMSSSHFHSTTPPQPIPLHKHPPEWDHSFSDDDILDHFGDCSGGNNSLGMPLLDTSSGSEDSFRQRSTSGSGYVLPSLTRRKNLSSPSCNTQPTTALECSLLDAASSFYSSSPVSCTSIGLFGSQTSHETIQSERMLGDGSPRDLFPMDMIDEREIAAAVHAIEHSGPTVTNSVPTTSPEVHGHTVEPRNLMKVFEYSLSEDERE